MASRVARNRAGGRLGLALAAGLSAPPLACAQPAPPSSPSPAAERVCPALAAALQGGDATEPCGLPARSPRLRVDAECRIQVAVTYQGSAEAVAERIRDAGGRIDRVATGLGPLVEAWVPAAGLAVLSRAPGVLAICLPAYAQTPPVPTLPAPR